jgi:hypothetical protein
VVVGDAATEWICNYAPRIRGQEIGVDGRSNAALTAQTAAAAAAAPALTKRLGGEQKFALVGLRPKELGIHKKGGVCHENGR